MSAGLEWLLHELEFALSAAAANRRFGLTIALPEPVMDDSNRGRPGSSAFVDSRLVRHLETDLLVRLVVPDGESGESSRSMAMACRAVVRSGLSRRRGSAGHPRRSPCGAGRRSRSEGQDPRR